MKHATYAGTRNLYEPILWAAKSLVANSSVDKIHLLIEDDEFPYELPEGLFEVYNVSDMMERVFPDGSPNAKTHFTKMALIRVCYCELFPDIDRVLQLDPDTLVMDNIDELWSVDLEGKWFAACSEPLSGYNPYHTEKYYNVGVCMFNLAQMREDNAQAQLVTRINRHVMNCVEQDALNKYVGNRAVELDTRFNENRACGYTDDPAIVHYLGYMDWQTNPNLPRREYLKLYKDKSWDEIMKMRPKQKKTAKKGKKNA